MMSEPSLARSQSGAAKPSAVNCLAAFHKRLTKIARADPGQTAKPTRRQCVSIAAEGGQEAKIIATMRRIGGGQFKSPRPETGINVLTTNGNPGPTVCWEHY